MVYVDGRPAGAIEYIACMPFTNCRTCSRLFHTFEPLLPESPAGYWPNLRLGNAAYELCAECLKAAREPQHDPDPDEHVARMDSEAPAARQKPPRT